MFQINHLTKQYGTEFALQDVNMKIEKGMNMIIGSSGSGKTTLLKILSGLETHFEGDVLYMGKDIKSFTEKEKSALYNHTFGFIWQDFHLLENATVLENILLPTFLGNNTDIENILKLTKLEDIKNQKVNSLSGGQKQRVAIAREMMKNPKVIFCDEPTSALDSKNAKNIMSILRNIAKSRTVIVVTHDTNFINDNDCVFEFDKGELISIPKKQKEIDIVDTKLQTSKLSFKNASQIAIQSIRNNIGRFIVSTCSLLITGILILTTSLGGITQNSQAEFQNLVESYGEGILDIGLIGSFINASGGNEDRPNGDVNQDLSGLYEKYENDERVEFIVLSQAFENINIEYNKKTYSIDKSGNSPVLTKLLSGNIPSGKEFQVVVPLKFVENIGLTSETAIGKEIDFSATIFQWINNTPYERPIHVQATICGVADNTVVYDYEGKQYSFTVDDSFFFNRSAIEEIRTQAGVADKSANFTIRAKTAEDLIALKDELNKNGIVPLGRFELVEDIVRLNQQTALQSESANIIITILAILLVILIFAMTSILRKKEYNIYKISGYNNQHLSMISLIETLFTSITAIISMIIASPIINMLTLSLFNANILSFSKLLIGALLILAVSVIAYLSELPVILSTTYSKMLKSGDNHD